MGKGFDMPKETEFMGLHQLVDFEDMIEDSTVEYREYP
jgi:hypothetical protein